MEWIDWLGLIVAMTWAAIMADWVLSRHAERAAEWAKKVTNNDW